MTDAPADLAFVGATVEPMVPGHAPADAVDAVAVREGRIVAVGPLAEVRAHLGPATDLVDCGGATLLPGFGDAHIHPIGGGMLADQCDLHDLADANACAEAIARYAAAHPDRPWIVGAGWSLDAFPGGAPDRATLDRLVGNRPAYLESNDGHNAWVSSRAIELAGITRDTPDPHGGRILREADGTPAGTLVDAAESLVSDLVPPASHEDRLRGLRAAQAHLHRLGITAWQDAHVEPDDLAVYREAAAAGWLTARVVAALWWEEGAGLAQIEAFEEQRASARIGRLRADSVKLMLDGIIESRTAHLSSPYLDAPGDHGEQFIERETLLAAVAELDRRGFQAHFHAIGDAAVRLALDAVEEARRRNGPSDGRHHAAHLELIDPADVPRFAAVGMAANIQPFWAVTDDQMRDLRLPRLGPVRARWQFPFRSLHDAGARLAGGSDWTVTTANPLLEMEVAICRVPPSDRDGEVFLPDERLPLDDALAAFTIGSAWVNHADAETGTVEPGKLADLVLLDRDIRAPDAGPLGDARVVATFVEGRQV